MNAPIGLERCFTFINCQLKPAGKPSLIPTNGAGHHAVTISRQSGSGGHTVAKYLAEYLQAATPKDANPWTVFDRNLVEKALEDHHLPKNLARFMPEDRVSEISDTMDELFGLHPPSWTLVRETADTILHLAELGNVILLGRGAAIITRRLNYVFHVRLVGSLERRVAHMQKLTSLGPKAALALVKKEDLGRRRYLRKYFDADVDDPLLYHLTLNTDVIPCAQAARIIANAVLGVGHPKP